MLKSSARPVIRLRGVRHNNLKNFDLDLPLNQLIVITGLSGSGKSSLAFDTLFAEGQRRYVETFSPYARQFFDRMDKPQVDSIEGIPPAIAIEQRNAVRTTRSTVGTMTEIADYMKVLWPHISELHCRQCGERVRKDSPQQIWSDLNAAAKREAGSEWLVTFDLPLSSKLSLAESLGLIEKQGYQRLLVGGEIVRVEEFAARTSNAARSHLTVIQDRLKPAPSNRARFVEACEHAYHFGKGRLTIYRMLPGEGVPGGVISTATAMKFSNRLHCARCDIEYREPTPALFSFNHPIGACPACKGFGRIISIDYQLALPDRSRTLAEGVVKPWQTGTGLESQRDLMRMCRQMGIPTDIPFEQLPEKWQALVIEGEPDYGKDEEHEWPRAWYGVKGYFRWLESKSYKMHVRVLLSRYRAYTPCPDCGGTRFQPETLLYRIQTGGAENRAATLSDFYGMPIRDGLKLIEELGARLESGRSRNDPVILALGEVRARLGFLDEVGLGYLTLDRATRSLSGGETERVNLTTCLGTRLVNTLFVLDEPSVGLHPRDTERLVRVLHRLRDAGNTVVVVEHEASVMRAADRIVDLGPGHGAAGGQVVFQGNYKEILRDKQSLTGKYLSGALTIAPPRRRPVFLSSPLNSDPAVACAETNGVLNEAIVPFQSAAEKTPSLTVSGATRHNLRGVTVEIPLGRFVCVTGVSGSGKTTLVREVLLPALTARLRSRAASLKVAARETSERFEESAESGGAKGENEEVEASADAAARISGFEQLSGVVLVDQTILGKTPRSNPAVYIGAFDDIREFFAQSDAARQRGLGASAFSFNSGQGQCERCRGAGFEKIEMQFLSDVFIRCPGCNGRRYRGHILEIAVPPAAGDAKGWSIADMLEATVDEAISFLSGFVWSRPAQRAAEGLRLLQEVGLGYLRLGQPINTLSGGESQRLKLVRHLAEEVGRPAERRGENPDSGSASELSSTEFPRKLFLFDEPTTGLHFDDVRVLLKVFQRIVNAGHSVLVVEHNLDVIRSADWIIDLGPGAGDEGGWVVAAGTPEQVAGCERSHTGRFLRDLIDETKDRCEPVEAARERGRRADRTLNLKKAS